MLDIAAFEHAAGVGIEVNPDEIQAAVAEVLTANEAELRTDRYHFNVNRLLPAIKAIGNMQWADIVAVKAQLEAQQVCLMCSY